MDVLSCETEKLIPYLFNDSIPHWLPDCDSEWPSDCPSSTHCDSSSATVGGETSTRSKSESLGNQHKEALFCLRRWTFLPWLDIARIWNQYFGLNFFTKTLSKVFYLGAKNGDSLWIQVCLAEDYFAQSGSLRQGLAEAAQNLPNISFETGYLLPPQKDFEFGLLFRRPETVGETRLRDQRRRRVRSDFRDQDSTHREWGHWEWANTCPWGDDAYDEEFLHLCHSSPPTWWWRMISKKIRVSADVPPDWRYKAKWTEAWNNSLDCYGSRHKVKTQGTKMQTDAANTDEQSEVEKIEQSSHQQRTHERASPREEPWDLPETPYFTLSSISSVASYSSSSVTSSVTPSIIRAVPVCVTPPVTSHVLPRTSPPVTLPRQSPSPALQEYAGGVQSKRDSALHGPGIFRRSEGSSVLRIEVLKHVARKDSLVNRPPCGRRVMFGGS